MSRRFLTAPFVLLTVLVLLAVLYGALAPAIEPLFETFKTFSSVQSNQTPVGPGDIDRIADVLFIQGPLVFLFGGILFVFLAALRLEGVLR